jgi:hypothetical protein
MEMIRPVAEGLLELDQKVNDLMERFNKLEHVVMEEMIGGITNLYKQNQRTTGIEGLKGKYGEMFEPYKDFYSTAYEGAPDMFEKIFDILEEMRGEGPLDEEAADGKIREIANGFESRVNKIRGVKPEVVAEIEVKGEEKPVDELEELRQSVMKHKASLKQRGL